MAMNRSKTVTAMLIGFAVNSLALINSSCTWKRLSSARLNCEKGRAGSIGNRMSRRSNMVMYGEVSGGSILATREASKVLQGRESVQDLHKIGDLTVPSVGIGTISWTSSKLNTIENMELQSLVDTAYQNNAAFFDTAERYGSHLKTAVGLGWGETERLVEKLLHSTVERSGDEHALTPVVATKFTPNPWRTGPSSVVDACLKSCERLGVEQIDLYQLHMPDIVQPFRFLGKSKAKDEIYWEGLAECYNRGLVKNVGVSNYGPTLLGRCMEALGKQGVPLASNQIAFSLLGRHNGAQETLDKCNELGIQVLAYYPFAMGLLTGKYSGSIDKTRPQEITPTLTSSKKTSLELKDLQRYAKGDGVTIPSGGISPVLDVMASIAEKRGKTLSQVALNYIICKGAIPIPGSRTAAQVQDNIGAMGWRLSPEEVLALEQEADSLGFGFDGAGFKKTSEKFVGYGVEKWSLD